MNRFQGAGALLVGGGSGLGLACARRILAEGASVTLAGRDPDRLAGAAADLDGGDRVRTTTCDVTDEDQVEAAVRVAAEGGGLRIVVAAPGIGFVAPLSEIPTEAWRRVTETNLTGTFLLLRAVVPHLAAEGGAFTAISSANAVRTSRFHAPYCVTKAGVEMLVRCAADELGAAGIRVNAVRPGLVPTQLSQPLVDDDTLRGSFLDQMPLRRLGTAEEVAAAVAFLSAPEAGWITGVCLSVDGGHHLRSGEAFDAWVRRDHPDPPGWWGVRS